MESAWRIGKTFLRYEVVRTQTVLAREPDPAGEAPPEVERLERFDHQARWLYDRCAGAFGASTIRDAEYLNWRFVENPFHDYTLYGVRDAQGVLRGYAVYRLADWKLPRMGVIVDWLVPPGERPWPLHGRRLASRIRVAHYGEQGDPCPSVPRR